MVGFSSRIACKWDKEYLSFDNLSKVFDEHPNTSKAPFLLPNLGTRYHNSVKGQMLYIIFYYSRFYFIINRMPSTTMMNHLTHCSSAKFVCLFVYIVQTCKLYECSPCDNSSSGFAPRKLKRNQSIFSIHICRSTNFLLTLSLSTAIKLLFIFEMKWHLNSRLLRFDKTSSLVFTSFESKHIYYFWGNLPKQVKFAVNLNHSIFISKNV